MHALFAVALLVLTLPAPAVEGIPADKAVIQLTSKFGPVRFDHLKHARRQEMACATCHHPMPAPRTESFICRDCHPPRQDCARHDQSRTACDEAPGAESRLDAKTAFHRLCRGCHDSMMSRFMQDRILPGPSERCRDCHD